MENMNFAQFFLEEEIENLFNNVDLYLRFLEGIDEPRQSFRNDRLKKNLHLDPLTNSSWRSGTERWRQLQAIISYEVKVNGTDPKKIWISFSELSKIGQRMAVTQGQAEPVGIFAFPALFAMKQGDSLPNMFSTRPYMHVFKTKSSHYEVGAEEDDKSAVNFKKAISKFPELLNKNEKLDNFVQELNNVQEKYSDGIDNWSIEDCPDCKDQNEYDLKQVVNNWVFELVLKIKNAISRNGNYGNYNNETKWIDRIKQLQNDLPWIADPKIALSDFAPDELTFNQKLKEIIASEKEETYLDGNYSFVPIFVDIKNDFSATLSPEVVKTWSNRRSSSSYDDDLGDGKFKWKGVVIDSNIENHVTLDQIKKITRWSIFDEYGGLATNLMKKRYNVKLLKSPTMMSILNDLLKGFKEVVTASIAEDGSDKSSYTYEKNLPYGKKLKKYADENGLDFSDAVQNSTTHAKTANQFLYRVTQRFAQQMKTIKKQDGIEIDWRMSWNKILRDLGIKNIADTRDTGHIHSAEPTQGIFMDPKDITLITTITQKTHSDKNDPANRPTQDSWYTYDNKLGQHSRTLNPSNQRVGKTVLGKEIIGKKSEDRFYYGILKRVGELQHELSDQYDFNKFDDNNFQKSNLILSILVKLIKAYNFLSKSGYKPPDNYYYNFVQKILTKISDIESNSTFINPNLKQKIEVLKQLFFTMKTIKTPIFKNQPNPILGTSLQTPW